MGARNTVVIRVDGSAAIGMGHVVRTLSLAQAFRAAGVDVEFLTRDDSRAISTIDAMAFPYRLMERNASTSLDEVDAAIVIERATAGNGCVVVDHYGAGSTYFDSLSDADLRICAIDDLADRLLSGAISILNPNPGISPSAYPQHEKSRLMLGGAYALLRDEFRKARSRVERRFSKTDNRILVTFGGGSVNKYNEAVVNELRMRGSSLEIRVAHGTDSAEMARLMSWADVCVSAGGQTCWELACLGVPVVAVQISENQVRNVAAVQELGLGINAGAWSVLETPGLVADVAIALLRDPECRQSYSSNGRTLIDGDGPSRAACRILEWSKS